MVVVSDTTMWAADVPSLCTGMRGLAAAEITLRGPDTDLHSGSFGGGVPNPLHAMAALLAGMHDETGRVTLPGFYDKVVSLTPKERELFARLPFDEKVWLADAGHSQAASGEAGYTTLERVWARPTAEINGMWGGYTGPGGKTIVPREAHAKVSFRLVADQEPAEVLASFQRYVAAHTPPGNRGRGHVRGRRGAAVLGAHRLPGGAGGQASGGARVRHRGAVHQGRGAAGRRPISRRSWPRRWSSSRPG